MNRFSQEVPPKTAWTVVAGLVVVFIMVFSLASNSEGGESTSMLGAVVKGVSSAVQLVTTPIKEALIPSSVKTLSEKQFTSTRPFTDCLADEAGKMRRKAVVASNERSSMPRAAHSDRGDVGAAIEVQKNFHTSIEAAIRATGATPIDRLSCLVTGFTVNATAAQLATLSSQGYAVTNFGGVAAAGSAGAAEAIQVGGGVN